MYCHAMATLALCEAYALTGDERLREPGRRGPSLSRRRARKDGLAWRDDSQVLQTGDTSILGWVVMALKSAKEVGIPIPRHRPRRGARLARQGRRRRQALGLGKYQPTRQRHIRR